MAEQSLRIDLHLHVHQAPDSETAAKLDQILAVLGGVKAQEETVMKELDDLKAEVEATKTVEESAVKLINGIPALIDAAVAKANTLPDLQAALVSLTSDLKASADGLGAAVTAGTSPAPDAPAPTA